MKRFHIKHKAIIILSMLFLYLPFGSAQYYRTGTEPAGVKWKSIKTDHIQVIFPDDQENVAQEFVSKFEYVLDVFRPQLKKKPKKLSIVLHHYHSRSNGLMTWAPRRMELWTRPPQDLAAQDWLELLIVHEYRHFVQISNLDQGFTSALKWIFGQQGQLVPLGFHIPIWYLEGDAVVAETKYSKAGRGRDPMFTQEFKSLVLEEGIPSYDLLFLGSYKNYVPNHYKTGYDIVAAHLLFNSETIFEEKLDNIAKHPFYLNPFKTKARGLRDRGRTKFYKEAVTILDSIWRSQQDEKLLDKEHFLLSHQNNYLNVKELKFDDGVLYAYAETFDKLPALVREEDGFLINEHTFGYLADPEIEVQNGCVVWVESRQDPRWEHKAASDIWMMDLKSKAKRRITKGLYLASPTLHPHKNQIAAVEYHPDYTFNLVVIDSESGAILHRIVNPENRLLFHPCWSDEGDELVYVSFDKNGKALNVWTDGKGEKEVLNVGYTEISNPVMDRSYIYFTGAFDGTNQIYSYSTKSGGLHKLTEAPFGANYVSVDSKSGQLYYSSWHSRGNRIVKKALKSGEKVKLNDLSPPESRFAEQLTDTQGQAIDFELSPKKIYKAKRYSKLFHSLHFHSWFPLSVDLDHNEFYPGLTLLSQDVLGNSELALKVNAHPSFRDKLFSADYTYYGMWPNISLNYSYGFKNETTDLDEVPLDQNNIYNSLSTSLSFPLNFSKHTWYRALRPSMRLGLQQNSINLSTSDGREGHFINRYVPLTLRLSGYSLKQMAKRDIDFPWGINFALAYSQSLGESEMDADLQYVNQGSVYGYGLTAYLKGLAAHHSIRINHSFQQKQVGNVIEDAESGAFIFSTMNNMFSMPRGYFDVNGENKQMTRLSFDYQLPIAHPDLRLGWIAYLKRIGGGLFVDYGHLMDVHDVKSNSVSYGGSIYFDCNFLRYEPVIRLGLQMGYNNLSEKTFSNLIFSVNTPW